MPPPPSPPDRSRKLTRTPASPINSVLERNIEALRARRASEEKARSFQERLADGIGAFAGSMPFVYVHAVIVGIWVAINLGLVKQIPKFDETFVILATVASVEAIFISTFILISQNRAARAADRRAELDMHVSLLAEHEVTRLIQITSAIARRLEIDVPGADDVEELKGDVAPEAVLDQIESTEAASPGA